MNYRAALFDFDGTLTPSLPLWVKAFRVALQTLGHEFSDAELVRRFFYRDWREVAEELQLESAQALQQEIHRGLRLAFKECELFPQVIAVLASCREAGMRVALVTSAPRFILDDVMPRLGLRDLFEHVVCADDVKNYKPHPEPVLLALSALACTADRAVMIGDSTADMLAGKAAGTATALFLPTEQTAFHHVESLRATEPDHIFTSHRELHGIFGLPY